MTTTTKDGAVERAYKKWFNPHAQMDGDMDEFRAGYKAGAAAERELCATGSTSLKKVIESMQKEEA